MSVSLCEGMCGLQEQLEGKFADKVKSTLKMREELEAALKRKQLEMAHLEEKFGDKVKSTLRVHDELEAVRTKHRELEDGYSNQITELENKVEAKVSTLCLLSSICFS